MADRHNTTNPSEPTTDVAIGALDRLSIAVRTAGALLRKIEVPEERDDAYLFNAALESIYKAEDVLQSFAATREE